ACGSIEKTESGHIRRLVDIWHRGAFHALRQPAARELACRLVGYLSLLHRRRFTAFPGVGSVTTHVSLCKSGADRGAWRPAPASACKPAGYPRLADERSPDLC